MRKKQKEITDPDLLEAIIRRATVCHLGLCADNNPYIVPLNFGYQAGKIFFHTGHEGLKMDLLRRNNRVCFEMVVDVELVQAETSCKWNMKYYSVIGFGLASIVDEPSAKRRALDLIVTHYGGEPVNYPEKLVEKTAVIQVDIDLLTGRQSGWE